jgi:hypothetical protein
MKVIKNYNKWINKYGESNMCSGQTYLDMIPTIKHTEDKDGSIRTTYKIPVGGLKPGEAKKKLRELMEQYKGLTIEQDYWFPVKTNDVDNTMEVDYFSDNEIKDSMIIDGEGMNNTEKRIKYIIPIEDIKYNEEKKPWYKNIFKK